MRTLIFLTVLLISTSLFSQEALVIEPKIGKTYDFSQEGRELWTTCDSLSYHESFREKLTQEERNVLMNKCDEIAYSEACDNMWDVVCGNDWTDEGYPYNQIDLTKAYNYTAYIKQQPNYRFTTVSSALKSTSENTYGDINISDLNYQTAWVEGVEGDGIGEFVTFNFQPGHPRITTVIIANGYIKTKEAWKNNARVKQLKMYVNNKPFTILNLEDVYAEQKFEIPTIGYKTTYYLNKDGTTGWKYKDENGRNVKSYHENSELQLDSIKFEILSVYKGDKYKDTAITEIYFDGLDVY